MASEQRIVFQALPRARKRTLESHGRARGMNRSGLEFVTWMGNWFVWSPQKFLMVQSGCRSIARGIIVFYWNVQRSISSILPNRIPP